MSDASLMLGLDYFLASLAPASPYGQAQARTLRPFKPGQESALREELASLEHALSLLSTHPDELAKIRHYLAELPDWREPLHEVLAGGVLSDVELFSLKQNLYFFARIKEILTTLSPLLPAKYEPPDFYALLALLDPDKTGSPSFYLSDSFSVRLAEYRAKIRAQQRAASRLSESQKERAASLVGLSFNPAGELAAPRHDRSLQSRIEATAQFILSRETYTERYYQLKPTSQELTLAQELDRLLKYEQEEEERVRHKLSLAVKQVGEHLRQAIASLGRLDLLLSKALLARNWRCVRPELVGRDEPAEFVMVAARHPEIEASLKKQGKAFTPISISLRAGVAIVTGANMGGKTVTLRTVGLLAALVAYGMFVPASHCRTGLFAHISILTGEYRAFVTGLSRFGHEIAALCAALPEVETRSLLLVDELASSTNPAEGSALAQAVAEHLSQSPSICLLTTHYDRLAYLRGVAHWQVVGLSNVPSQELAEALADDPAASRRALAELMDYTLTPTEPTRHLPREALRVASHLGLPESILVRAAKLLRR
ncbi:MAG: Endonuclease MutS2 [Firmicutes bacterium]|nr:Endonuclease MutS2 [candidate division NPL-UPA2 bacterium]